MAFQGSLADLALPDVIQMLQSTGKTGRLLVHRGREEGEISLQGGRIVDAHHDSLDGEEAVYEIALWQAGDFVFEPGPVGEQVSVRRSNHNLMLEASRRLDEWAVLQKRIPSIRCVPELIADTAQDRRALHPREQELVHQVDGEQSLETIANKLGTSPFEAAKMLYGLLSSGFVRLRSAREAL